MNLNKAFVLGRVTADPQLRTTPGGQSVTTFGVATNRIWRDKMGAQQQDTQFHNIVAWGKQAEIAAQYLKKGALVLVEGRLQTRSWQDKQGQTHRTTEIICDRMQLGPRAASRSEGFADRPEAPAAKPAESAPAEEIPTVDIDDDIKMEDLPF